MFKAALLGILVIASFVHAEAANPGGLQTSIAGDIVGAQNRLQPREVEVLFYAPIDHYFDGLASMAAHEEDGEFKFEIHEVYLGSTKLIPRSRFRLGQFFLGFGRLNQFHRHDWPFISAPSYHTSFFRTDEAALDAGIEYSYLLPTSLYLDFTAGITNGWVFGHAHGVGAKPYMPTHYLRLVTYADLPWRGGTQIGLNYVGRRDEDATQTSLLGLDVTAKWREAQFLQFLFQSETWLKIKAPRDAESESTLGFYLFPQYALTQTLFLGTRFDGLTITNSSVGNFEYAVVPTLTWKPSEFSTFRTAYTYRSGSSGGQTTVLNRIFEVQAVFILGSHPAHDF